MQFHGKYLPNSSHDKACSYVRFFCCDFPLLIDVNEWINKICDECMLYQEHFDWFTGSHPSKGENRTRNGPCEQNMNKNEIENQYLSS
jgi:hypothetical protein